MESDDSKRQSMKICNVFRLENNLKLKKFSCILYYISLKGSD